MNKQYGGFNQQVDLAGVVKISCPICTGSIQKGVFLGNPHQKPGLCSCCNNHQEVWLTRNGAMLSREQYQDLGGSV